MINFTKMRPVKTGREALDSALDMLRRRMGATSVMTETTRCSLHGESPIGLFCHQNGQEYLCGRCLKTMWAPVEPLARGVKTPCHSCSAPRETLLLCNWCNERFCADCMADADACWACGIDRDYPPEERKDVRNQMRGS